MANYQINLTNGNILTTLIDNTVDNTTSLTLVGHGYAGYGQIIADDMVHLLENAANTTAPPHPLIGQLWFNTTTDLLNVWTGSAWFALTTGVSSVLGNTGAVTLSQLTTAGLAPINSPIFTGTPSGPTAAPNTATTQLATTAFVTSTVNALATGVSSVLGLTGAVNLAQLVTGGLAPLSSPILTGVPTAPTPTVGTNNTQVATTAFVISQVGALSTGVSSVLGNTGAVTLQNLTTGGLAPSLSPALGGIPTTPTAATGNNTGQIASTGFVQAAQTALLVGNNTWSGSNTYTNVGSGGLIMANNMSLIGKSTSGTSQALIGLSAANDTLLFAGPSGKLIIGSSNGTVQLLAIDSSGNGVFNGAVSANGIDPSGGGQIRANGASYGFMILNDDVGSYLLLTNASNPHGTYNGLRPLSINNSNGAVALDGTGAGVTASGPFTTGGPVTANGNITANNGRLLAEYGAYQSGLNNAAVLLLDYQFSGAGYFIFPNGAIFQWLTISAPQTPSYITANLPMAFPHGILSMVCSDAGSTNTGLTSTNSAKSGGVINNGTLYSVNVTASGPASINVFLIGY